MLLKETGDAVGQQHADIDLRIGLEEIDHDRHDVQTTEDERCGDDQFALRRAVFARGGPFGLFDLIEYAPAGRDIVSPRLGQRQPAPRAGKQPCVEMRLELRDLAADGRERCSESAAGRRKAAGPGAG